MYHVKRGAAERLGKVRGFNISSESEISNFQDETGTFVLLQKQVLWFQVPMNQIVVPKDSEGTRQLMKKILGVRFF